jgi:hypothetical protein
MLQNQAPLEFKIKAGDTVETFRLVVNLNFDKSVAESEEYKAKFKEVDDKYAPLFEAVAKKEINRKKLVRLQEDLLSSNQLLMLEAANETRRYLVTQVQSLRADIRKIEDENEELERTYPHAEYVKAVGDKENFLSRELLSLSIVSGDKEKLFARLEELHFAYTVAFSELRELIKEATKKK